MATGRIRIPVFKGINQTFPEIAFGYAANAENMDVSDGILRVTKGTEKVNTTAGADAFVSLAVLHKRTGSVYSDHLLAATADSVYIWDGSGFILLKSGLSGGVMTYLNYQLDGEDICVLSNGIDTPFFTDGSTCTNMTAVPAFKDIALHYERMWGSGVTGYPDRVYYSAAFDPRDFSTLNESGFIELPSFDGGYIIAIETLFDDVVVFKPQSVYRIIGTYPGTYEVSRIHGVVGTIAGKSIVNTGDLVLFLSSDGICAYNGIKAVPFKPGVLDGIYDRINTDAVHNAVGVKWGGKVLFALPLDGAEENNAVLEYDLASDSFMLKTGITVHQFAAADGKLYISDGTPYIKQYGIGDTFNGEPIAAFWETPFTDAGDRSVKKYLEHLYAFGKGTGMTITVTTEHESKQKTIKLNPASSDHIKAALQGKGVRFKLTFQNVGGGYFELVSPEIWFEKDA